MPSKQRMCPCIWLTSVARHKKLSEVSKIKKKKGRMEEKRSLRSVCSLLLLISFLAALRNGGSGGGTGNSWSRILRQIYYRASHNDTANKALLTAAVLAKHLEMCDRSSFVVEVAGRLERRARLTLQARRKTAKCSDLTVAFNVQQKKRRRADTESWCRETERGKWRGNKLGLLGHVWCNVKGAKSAALLPYGIERGPVKKRKKL